MEKEIHEVKKLGEVIGYGNMMSIASALWRKSLKEKGFPISGAFIPALGELTDDEKRYDSIVEKVLSV